MRAYLSTVSILGSSQAEELQVWSPAWGAGYGGSILSPIFAGGVGPFCADYHRDPEWQANDFAGAILMPKPMVLEAIYRKPNPVEEIVQTFHTSRTSAEVRLNQVRN